MTALEASAALLRSRLVSRSATQRDEYFASGNGTKGATKPHERQASGRAAERVIAKSRRKRVTPEEREKEIERRRKWASGGDMPPEIRACYSEAERAALAVIADRCRTKGFCDLCLDEIARIAGISRTSVQNAIRKARSKSNNHISVRERPQAPYYNLTNVIKIISRKWCNWIVRAIGFKRLSTSVTKVKTSLFETAETEKSAFEKAYAAAGRSPSKPCDWQKAWSGEQRSHWHASAAAYG